MQTHYEVVEVQDEGAMALTNLSVVTANKRTIAEEGGHVVLSESMQRHIDQERLQHHGCMALRNLAVDKANMESIRECDGHLAIVEAEPKP